MQCKSVSFPHETLRSLLSDAIVELCRREAFYVEELRIEGTICVVSDRSSALIVQITEQVGNKTSAGNSTDGDGHVQLPVVVTTKLNFDPTSGPSETSRSRQGEGRSGSLAVKHYAHRRLLSCRHCGAHFIRLGSLRSHIRRRHPLSVFSARRKRVTSYLSSNKTRKQPSGCRVEGTGGGMNVSGNSDVQLNQDMRLSVLKSEPAFSAESLRGFPPDLNLSLQQMVRTLSMMSSLPINSNGHFPPTFTVASSGNSYPADDDPVELRRSADGKFACPYCTKTYGFKHSLKEHIDVHRGRRPHICRHCGASFAHLASLCAHIRRRHDDRMPAEFRCSLCGEKLMNLQSLKQHRTWRHKDAPRLSDPLPPPVSSSAADDRSSQATMSVPGDQLLGGKKDGRLAAGNFTHLQRSTTTQWSSGMFPSISAPLSTTDLQSKMPSSTTSRLLNQRKDSTADLPPFDGFDFHGFLPSVNDFQPVAATNWSSGHVTTPGIDSTDCHTQMSASSSHKFFPDTSELPATAGHSQSKTPSDLHYRPAEGIPDPYFMTAVCPGCSAKFRTETEYRRHVACNPDHVTLSWRQ